ncbi:MAG: hypothetical protein ACTS6P_00695 [Candidatus Hodgkinia cicadicola]
MLKCPPNDRKQASSLTFEHVLRLLTISPSSADIVLSNLSPNFEWTAVPRLTKSQNTPSGASSFRFSIDI